MLLLLLLPAAWAVMLSAVTVVAGRCVALHGMLLLLLPAACEVMTQCCHLTVARHCAALHGMCSLWLASKQAACCVG